MGRTGAQQAGPHPLHHLFGAAPAVDLRPRRRRRDRGQLAFQDSDTGIRGVVAPAGNAFAQDIGRYVQPESLQRVPRRAAAIFTGSMSARLPKTQSAMTVMPASSATPASSPVR